VISSSTAAELIEVLREVVSLGRLARQADVEEGSGGLHVGPAALLGLLADAGEQRLGVLACALDLDASVVSRRVTALEEAGLVVRRADPDDRRAQLVAVTEPGAEAVRRHRAVRAEQVADALAHRSDEDVAHIVGGLRGLLADLHRSTVPSRSRTAVG
jgi:DNA-binding MarR family transcriptional regulator